MVINVGNILNYQNWLNILITYLSILNSSKTYILVRIDYLTEI